MIDWDAWRTSYRETSFAEQSAFYERVFDLHPEQDRFSVKAIEPLLAEMCGPLDVVELGGWQGGFAAALLPAHPEIRSWMNYEIAVGAARASVCSDSRYRAIALEHPYWGDQHQADLFVASHVLEHLTLEDVRRTLDATEMRWAYVQAPLQEGPSDWSGYHGSHILEVGWGGLIAEFEERALRLLERLSRPGVRCFGR